MDQYLNYNGQLLPADQALLPAQSRAFRYGDGLFETMSGTGTEIPLFRLHMERLFAGLKQLQFDLPAFFTPHYLQAAISVLQQRNKMTAAVRIRLSVFRGNGGLFDPENHRPNFIIELNRLPDQYQELNENGYQLTLFPGARKSCDLLSGLKSNNYLPYALAAIYARQHQKNDCLLLNQFERPCDSSMANLFLIHNGQVITPPLSEGCVAGTMRHYLLQQLKKAGYAVAEVPVTDEMLANASECFLTNAVYRMRWVSAIDQKQYHNEMCTKIYRQFLQTIPAE